MDLAATRIALLVTVMSAGCVGSTSNVCDDGSTCPGGFVCDIEHSRCLLPEQISACEGVADDMPCTLASEPTAGAACRDGACIAFFCGDGYVTSGEDCELGQSPEDFTANCKDFGAYVEDGLSCSTSCTFDPGDKEQRTGCFASAFCGDLETNGPELCDGPQARTCVSIGYDAGTTSCTLDCGFTIGDCSRFGWNPESIGDVFALGITGAATNDQWAFGLDGHAMHFEGAFWNAVPTGVTNDLINGWSFGAKDTWLVGASRNGGSVPSTVLHWDGTAWSTVTGLAAAEYVDVWGPNANEVHLATSAAILVRNGASWMPVSGFTGTPRVMRGSASNDVWVATQGGPLMHYDGASWTDRSPPGARIQFLDVNAPDDVWAIGHPNSDQGAGVIAHWNGSRWRRWVTASEPHHAVASTGPAYTWVAAVDGRMRPWDGVAWSRSQNIGASPSGLTALSGLIALAPDAVVGVSTLYLSYRYRGQAFGAFPPLGTNPFDAPDNSAIWGTAASDQFVGNVKGEVFHFNGTTWTLVFATASSPIRDLDGRAANDVWMVAANGSAYHFDGTSWTELPVTPGIGLERVWIDDATGDVWVFGSTGGYHRTGNTWTFMPFGGGTVINVSGSSPSNIWAVQRNPSTLWHYDGSNWTEVVTGSTYQPLAVVALSPEDIHVTLTQGRFAHSNGSVWTETALPVLADLRFLAASAPDDIVAASERDLAHFNGTAWSTVRTPIDFVPNTADYLPMVDLQVVAGRIDMLLQRFRIRTLIRTRPLICRAHETCGDSVDNDCNGKIDKQDAECP